MGFDGKTLIHPSTISTANHYFGPTPEEICQAERIIAAHTKALAEGKGIAVVDGRLVEALHVEGAQRTLALAAAVQEMSP